MATIREVSSTLSAARRDMLLMLQRREDLKSVLLKKLKLSFGRCGERVVEKEVANFARRAKVTDANLSRLERRVRYLSQREDERATGKEITEEDAASAFPSDVVSNYSLTSSMISRSSSTPSFSRKERLETRGDLPTSYNWSRLDSYANFLQQHDEKLRKEQLMETRQRFRDELDQQMVERKRMSQEHVASDRHYCDNIDLELANWQKEECCKQENARNLWKVEKEFWDWQNERGRMLKATAKEKEQCETDELLDRISRELQLEKEHNVAKQERRVATMRAIAEENEENKRKLREAKDADIAKDAAYQVDYERMMQEIDIKKKVEVDQRNAKLREKEKEQQFLFSSHAQKVTDSDIAGQQAKHTEDLASALEKAKTAKRQEIAHRTQDFLCQQMEEKRCKKEKDKDLRQLLASTMKHDVHDFTRGQEEMKIQGRLRNLENRVHLEEQIRQKANTTTADMSSGEIVMNANLIRVAERALRDHRLSCKDACTSVAELEDSSRRAISQITFG